MKISKQARINYMEHCPLSTMKCESRSEIDYKVLRAAELGKLILQYGEYKVVRYYCLNLYIENREVMKIEKDIKRKVVHISEKSKNEHWMKYYKVAV